MNTQIKGQQGYKKDSVFDKMGEAAKIYKEHMWIIKWENKWHQETKPINITPSIRKLNYLKDLQDFFQAQSSITVPNRDEEFGVNI